MIFKTHIPGPPLSSFVDSFWFWQSDAVEDPRERRLPTGSMEVVINLGERPFRIYDPLDAANFEQFDALLICGVQRSATVTNSSNRAIGVHFKPGGAHPFLAVSPTELQDTHVSLETIWGHSSRRLYSQLMEAKDIDSMFVILESYLLANTIRPMSHHPAVAFALEEFANVSRRRTVSEIAKQTSYSKRRFIELFDQEVGLTPKIFSRIQRFQAALELARRSNTVNWTEVALVCGYYDQAHLIREFQTFSRLTPTAYQTEHGDNPSYSV